MTQYDQLSGADFLEVVEQELNKRNSGLGRVTETEVCRAAGIAPSYLRMLRNKAKPNPSTKFMRLILYVLNLDVPNSGWIRH